MARNQSSRGVVLDDFTKRCCKSCPSCGHIASKKGECRKPDDKSHGSTHRCYYCGHEWPGEAPFVVAEKEAKKRRR